MRKIALFVLGSALFGLSVAQAGDDHPHERRDRRFELQCRYLGATLVGPGLAIPGIGGPMGGPGYPGKGGPVPPKGGGVIVGPPAVIPVECLAKVRIEGRHDDDDWLTSASSPEAPGAVGTATPGSIGVTGDRDDRGDEFRRRRDRLEIFCDGVPVYSDGAVRTNVGGFEFLSGISTPLTPIGPILKFNTFGFDDFDDRGGDDRRDDRRRSFVVDSWLNIGGNVMAGFCAVERRDRDRDHHDLSLN